MIVMSTHVTRPTLVGASLIALAVASAAAQQPREAPIAPTPLAAAARAAAAAKSYTPPRTPWGHPDIQGSYNNTNENGVPMERPDQFPAAEGMSEAEFQKIVRDRAERARATAGRIGGAETGAGPSHWYEHLEAQNSQLWLIQDPANGKYPPMTPEGQKRQAAAFAARRPEPKVFADLNLYDRCITRGIIGSMLPVIYGNSASIIQGPNQVAITNEMIHETRIVPLDDSPRPGDGIRQLMGVSRGRWDGNTLVVETTHLTNRTAIGVNGGGAPHSEKMKVTERFIPIDASTLRWEVTIDDPATWTRPWTFGMPLKKDASQPVFEYACHEGNYALRNMLTGAAASK
jgi:hypothetical protein